MGPGGGPKSQTNVFKVVFEQLTVRRVHRREETILNVSKSLTTNRKRFLFLKKVDKKFEKHRRFFSDQIGVGPKVVHTRWVIRSGCVICVLLRPPPNLRLLGS